MPHEHLPGPRAQLKADAMQTIAAQNPGLLQIGTNCRPNLAAIARVLRTAAPTLNRMTKGQLPVNLEVVVAHIAARGTWDAAGELIEIVDEHGNPVNVRPCECTDREPVAA